ncbi:UNVERIFIED_CONTAM: hypothetical protein Sradi_1765600 [Sesamum radiatum]|uniref:Integrase catalytic domain-containing protein n=1 Tax=Sesamum radiatum TaxID=300843 RepID=A0AAW2TUS7_SESRA
MGLSTYEKEFLALLLAVTRWKHYLIGNHFIIRTDPKSLKHILDQRVDSILQQKWITKLLGLSYEVQYKKGSDHRAADALSRMEHTFPDYNYEKGILRKKGRICVGSHGDIRKKIIKSLHDSTLGGHSGINGTYQRIKPLFFWPTLKEDVTTWVKECEVCQRSKHENVPYPGLLQPWPIPSQAWSCISMDFVEGLPPSEGKDSVLVIVDRLTKYSHFIPLKHPYTSTTIAKIFFHNIYKLHGLPVSIVTDRDRVFTSRFWRELFTLAEVSLDMSSAYHPQSDRQTERDREGSIPTRASSWIKSSSCIPCFAVEKENWGPSISLLNLPEIEDEVFKVYPAAILARRLVPRNNVGVPEVLIQWSHSYPDQVTWEDYKDMAAKFPGFDPWGQGSKKGGRDVAFGSRNATPSGHRPIARTDKDHQIEGGIEIGGELRNLEGNSVVLEKG